MRIGITSPAGFRPALFYLDPKKYERLVKWTADLKGVKPAISKRTISAGKMGAVLYIVLGIALILFGTTFNSVLKNIGVSP